MNQNRVVLLKVYSEGVKKRTTSFKYAVGEDEIQTIKTNNRDGATTGLRNYNIKYYYSYKENNNMFF